MPDLPRTRREDRILMGLFALGLLVHLGLATRNWSVGFMPGHEFRQAQTAFISRIIDREDNFSLLYETPLLGKPWVSILLEVPFYEWSVVLLSRATHWPHVVAARFVSLACFYLCLPAFWLLLERVGLSRPRRLLTLTLVLCCPVYIFYSRSFLMESMELMCCAWFLVGFLWMMDRRRWPWFLLTAFAGTGAALIKSATLAVWLLPAAAYGAWMLGQEVRARRGWGALGETVFWGVAGVIVPLGMLRLWIALTDPLKAAHASAWIFTSKNLSQGNWGLTDFRARFSPATWSILLERWREAVMPPWLIGVTLVAGLIAFPAHRRRIAGLASVFFLAQLMFPFAYAYQEYYFYACAVFLLGGLACAQHGLLDSRLPRWLCWPLLLVLPLAQLHTYWRVYYGQQLVGSNGGFSFTEALREFVPREAVIVVAGADWAGMVPLYSGHKALMIRNGLDGDPAYLARAFAELADEDVAALVLMDDQRNNRGLVQRAAASFDLAETPAFSHPRADVYCSRRYGFQIQQGIRERNYYGELKPGPALPDFDWSRITFRISEGYARSSFGNISPRPIRGHFRFSPSPIPLAGGFVLNAHPEADLWLHPPAGATRIEWDFGMFPDSYERAGDRTDGVEFLIWAIQPLGGSRVIFERALDPVRRVGDRGRQHESIPYHPLPGEFLEFMTRPRESLAYDWAYWARIDVK